MRSCDEFEHVPCDDVLGEVDGNEIFYILQADPDEGLEPGDEDYLGPDEFALANDWCEDDPLILTRAELRRLGEQLIEMAEQKN